MNLQNAEAQSIVNRSRGIDPAHRVRVEIYVADHCQICDYTLEVAELIRQEYPQVDVHMVDLMDPVNQIPPEVFATPTYLLNGRIWSLGNPAVADVRSRLSSLLAG